MKKKGLHILLFEDAEADAYLINTVLQRDFEANTVFVKNAGEFKVSTSDDRYDIIIVDYDIQDLNFEDAILDISEKNSDTPVIVISEHLSPEHQLECLELGAKNVLAKSDINKIAFVIRRCLAEYKDKKDLKEAFNALEKNVKEKEILIAEIHHRVKNNLAIISGLLELSKFQLNGKNGNEESIFNDNILRIKGIAMVYERLYKRNDMKYVLSDELLNDVCSYCGIYFSRTCSDVKIVFNADKVSLNINQAIPFALLICEFISNAMKLLYTNDQKGVITANFEVKGRSSILTLSCEGLREERSIEEIISGSLSSMLLKQFILQLDASYEVKSLNSQAKEAIISFELIDKKGSGSALV